MSAGDALTGRPTNVITDPTLKQAFIEGVKQGMEEIHSSNEPTWEVKVSFDGTLLNEYVTQSAEKVLLEARTAVTNGCAITITPVTPVTPPEHGIAKAITEARDDEVVDAEIVP